MASTLSPEEVAALAQWPEPVLARKAEKQVNLSLLDPATKRLVWEFLNQHHPETASLLADLRKDPVMSELIELTGADICVPEKIFSPEVLSKIRNA